MKKFVTTSIAAAVFAAFAPAVFAGEKERNIAAFKAAGYTLVNEDCAYSQLFIELNCYSSNNPVLIAPGEIYLRGQTYEDILQANPGIKEFVTGGYLPPKHWFAMYESTLEMSNLE